MAGSIVVTVTDAKGGYTKYSIAWTSDASGNVSATAFDCRPGALRNVKFVPGSGGTQPTNLYTVKINDADGADVLAALGVGSGLSNATATFASPGTILDGGAGALTPVIASAGNAKTGVIALYVGPGP